MHLCRQRIGGNVEVLGFVTEQQVADATPYQVGLVAGLAQAAHYLQGFVAYGAWGNVMRVRGIAAAPGEGAVSVRIGKPGVQ